MSSIPTAPSFFQAQYNVDAKDIWTAALKFSELFWFTESFTHDCYVSAFFFSFHTRPDSQVLTIRARCKDKHFWPDSHWQRLEPELTFDRLPQDVNDRPSSDFSSSAITATWRPTAPTLSAMCARQWGAVCPPEPGTFLTRAHELTHGRERTHTHVVTHTHTPTR